jgi:hypothetical protein
METFVGVGDTIRSLAAMDLSSCFLLLDGQMTAPDHSSDEEWAQLPGDGDGIWDDFHAPEKSLMP